MIVADAVQHLGFVQGLAILARDLAADLVLRLQSEACPLLHVGALRPVGHRLALIYIRTEAALPRLARRRAGLRRPYYINTARLMLFVISCSSSR